MYPQYKKKLLIDCYDKQNDIKNSHNKHKWLDKTNREYLAIEDTLDKHIVKLKVLDVCFSSFMIKVEALRIIREEAEKNYIWP